MTYITGIQIYKSQIVKRGEPILMNGSTHMHPLDIVVLQNPDNPTTAIIEYLTKLAVQRIDALADHTPLPAWVR